MIKREMVPGLFIYSNLLYNHVTLSFPRILHNFQLPFEIAHWNIANHTELDPIVHPFVKGRKYDVGESSLYGSPHLLVAASLSSEGFPISPELELVGAQRRGYCWGKEIHPRIQTNVNCRRH